MNPHGSVLVDTNVVVAYFRGEKALAPRFAEAATFYPLEASAERLSLKASAISFGLPSFCCPTRALPRTTDN
jgi:hypothetical protein